MTMTSKTRGHHPPRSVRTHRRVTPIISLCFGVVGLIVWIALYLEGIHGLAFCVQVMSYLFILGWIWGK